MQIEIGVSGDVQVSRQILRVGDRELHAQPAFHAIADQLYGWEAEQFASEGEFASGGWAPLAARTRAHKLVDRILFETGALARSLTHRGGDNVLVVNDDWMAFGTTDAKAGFHQRGTSRMPRRRPLELNEQMRQTVVKVLQRWIVLGELDGGVTAFEQVAGQLG